MKNEIPTTTKQQLGFEQIMSWFGQFTPQLKFQLMFINKHSSFSHFEKTARDVIGMFRLCLFDLARIPKGADRALRSFQLMDNAKTPLAENAAQISCSRGCSACCRMFPKQITSDEADLLLESIEDGLPIDYLELQEQAESLENLALDLRTAASHTSCIFLDAAGKSCRVYSVRPGTCRKYHVSSPAENCETVSTETTPVIDLNSEIVMSAAMSLPDNQLDWMPLQIWRRLTPEMHQELAQSASQPHKPIES
jgi:Fe-S-cluster containining protein